jgi:hypothetical protein
MVEGIMEDTVETTMECMVECPEEMFFTAKPLLYLSFLSRVRLL